MSRTLWAGRLVALVAGLIIGVVIFCVLALVAGTVFPLLGIATPGLYNEVEAISAEIDPGSAGEIIYEENYGTGAGVTPHHVVVIAGPNVLENLEANLSNAGFRTSDTSIENGLAWHRGDPKEGGYERVRLVIVESGQTVGVDRTVIDQDGVMLEIG